LLENRKYIIQIAFLLVASIYIAKLFSLQVLDEKYKYQAENKTKEKIVKYPLRGLIFDRNGNILVDNQPVFDLKIIAREFDLADTTSFRNLLEMDSLSFYKSLNYARYGSPKRPDKLQRFNRSQFVKLTVEQHAKIQDRLSNYKGVYIEPRTLRTYPYDAFAVGLGYVKEISNSMLKRDKEDYYKSGDLVGIAGLEKNYEEVLRGKRGVQFMMRDVFGVQKASYKAGSKDIQAEMGQDLTTSIDIDLQEYGEKLMANKRGSIVAIEPSTGEILAMVSAPTYNPNMLTGDGRTASRNFLKLSKDINKPLFNRAVMATSPPGSTFKIAQALIGLQDGVIDTVSTRIGCNKSLVNCHNHGSPLNVHGSIQHSCNPFYYVTFSRILKQKKVKDVLEDTRIGLTNWRKQMLSFGFGRKLGLDWGAEKTGNIPSVSYYDKRFKNYPYPWKFSNIYSVSIGQGEVNISPIQLANFSATLANRGYFYTPHLIKKIGDGTQAIDSLYTTKNYTTIDTKYFPYVVDAMSDVVKAGTARRARTPNIEVCGKTGTVQNPHGEDHSVFIAFAPKDNPKIALAVYIENAGFGGTWAAPIASLMIEQYLTDSISNKYKEQRILDKSFLLVEVKPSDSKPLLKENKIKNNLNKL
jgi:penicillin-binding protein 2